ncbi:hypothetical protein CR513_05353, partial [Mucuna pruriens]
MPSHPWDTLHCHKPITMSKSNVPYTDSPRGYALLVNNNSDPYTSTTNPHNQNNTLDPSFKTNGVSYLPPTYDAQNHQAINPMPIVIIHPHQPKVCRPKDRLQFLEERLKAIEGTNYLYFNIVDLCQVLDVVILPNFKLLEFDKYKGDTCSKDLVIIGERVEVEVKNGKIAHMTAAPKKPTTTIYRKKIGETNAIISTPPVPNRHRPWYGYNPQVAVVPQPSYQ